MGGVTLFSILLTLLIVGKKQYSIIKDNFIVMIGKDECVKALAIGLFSLNIVAFSPISAKGNVDNALAAEGACAGECYTQFETSEGATKCIKIWTETSLQFQGIADISTEEEALASL